MHIISGHNSEFALRLIDARKSANLTQEALAERVGIDKRSISQYENGHMFPRGETLTRLAEQLTTDATWLATGHTKNDREYFASQNEKTSELGRKAEMLFIENWGQLPEGTPMNTPRYNPKPRYGLESSVIESFVPAVVPALGRYRATSYPGAYPAYSSYPGGSILIFDPKPTTHGRISGGAVVIFRIRGEENAPGLRRVARESGLSESLLIPLDGSSTASPIPFDDNSIVTIGVVVTQVIDRRAPESRYGNGTGI